MNRRQFIVSATAAMTFCPTLQAAEKVVYQSTMERVAVLELFTSEGCSSCPPADEWFSKLRTTDGLWTKFIPLAFHVDYWDYIGWKDSLASAANSNRQRQYAATWRSDRVYTPGFVMNGQEWRANQLTLPPAIKVGTLRLGQAANASWNVVFEPVSGELNDLVFHVVLLGSVVSKVTAGENSGKTLKHDFVVLSHAALASNNGQAALKLDADSRATAVAGWVSRGSDPTPVQAVGGRL